MQMLYMIRTHMLENKTPDVVTPGQFILCNTRCLSVSNFIQKSHKIRIRLQSIPSGPPHHAHNNTTHMHYETKTQIHADKQI